MNKTIFGFGIILCLMSCERKEQPMQTIGKPKILRMASKEDPYLLDPRIAGERRSQSFLRLMYEGLTCFSKEGKVIPAVAEKIEQSDDGLIYHFYLKKTKWSDGSFVTAYDFEYAWKKVLSPSFPTNYAYAFYDIKNAKEAKEGVASLDQVGIKVISDIHLIVELNHPTPYFLELTSNPLYFPVAKILDEQNPNWGNNGPFISNGAFKLKEWKFRRSLEFEKNPFYREKDSVFIDGIFIPIINDEWTSLLLFEQGELDWVGDPYTNIPYDAISDLKTKKMLGFATAPSGFWYVFNTEIFPFQNPKLRRAFALAISREVLTEHILQGWEMPAYSVLPSTMQLRKEPLLQENVQEAKRLFLEALNEMGISKETLPPIVITGTNKHLLLTQAIKEQWREVFDIDLRIQSLEWNVYLNKLFHHDFQIGSTGWESWYNDPIYNLSAHRYQTSQLNPSGWEHPLFSQYLDASYKEYDSELRKYWLSKAEEILMEEMPVIPVHYTNRLFLKSKSLKDVFFTPLGNPDFFHAKLE